MIKPNVTVLFAVCMMAAGQATAEDQVFSLPDGQGALVLPVPPGWVEETQGADVEGPPAMTFRSSAGEDFRVLIVPFPGTGVDIAGMVRDAARGIAPIAAEREIDIKSLGGGVKGYWFGYTDATLDGRTPPVGEYRFTVQGAAAIGKLTVTFTVLTNDGNSDVIVDALRMVRGARYRGGT